MALALAVFSISVMSGEVYAVGFPEVSLSSNQLEMFNGETTTLDLFIKNPGPGLDTYRIIVSPSYWNFVQADPEKNLVQVAGGDTAITKIFFSSTADAQFNTQLFVVTVKSVSDPNTESNATVGMRILHRSPIFVMDVESQRASYDPLERVVINTTVSNTATSPSDDYVLETVVSKDGQTVQKFVDQITSMGGNTIRSVSNEFVLDRYQTPGVYSIRASLKSVYGGLISAKSSSFVVNEVYKLPTDYTSKDVEFGFLSIGVSIGIKNEGNVKTPPFYVTESIPSFARTLFDPEIEPNYRNETDSRVVYTWYVPTLNPGQETMIKYKFVLWYVWMVLVSLVAVVWLMFTYVFTPTIIKRYVVHGHGKDKEILVSLEVRNKSIGRVKDISVVDTIPGIARVTSKFLSMKPSIRDTGSGTELAWKIDTLHPGEERVLSYRIKPVMEVKGTIRLPGAEMRYSTVKKARKATVSNDLTVR